MISFHKAEAADRVWAHEILKNFATDAMARYKRLQGFNVLHPMGFDSYGLPAEQYAIQTGQHPEKTTMANIAHYVEQLRKIGFCYDSHMQSRPARVGEHIQHVVVRLGAMVADLINTFFFPLRLPLAFNLRKIVFHIIVVYIPCVVSVNCHRMAFCSPLIAVNRPLMHCRVGCQSMGFMFLSTMKHSSVSLS